ncbi:DUF3078 domain-containing protein [Coprobacter secundus]|uniref:DUF3078 domain-containing protein n=2 Tax=Coprobacter TaxID=1348911 RepID=UPI00352022FE
MNYRRLFTMLLSVITIAVCAETKKDSVWITNGYAGLKLTQVSFTNWATGGDNAFAFDLQGTYQADYKHNKHIWQNRIELSYGLNKTKSEITKKTSDKIYLNSNYGYEIYKNLYLSALFNFQSQFTRGYDYGVNPDVYVSQFMAPGYLMTGIGFTWIPNKFFTAVLSPAAWRGTFVLNDRLSDEGAYGVKPGKKLLSEFGANLKLEGRYEFLKNMTLYSRLDLYSDYLRKPQNVDINWEVQINMVINKWFSTTLTTNMVYDDDVKITLSDGRKVKRIQFKELLGVGLQFNF